MKKLLLTSSFLYFTAVASPSLAVECTTVPSCSSLGYVDITSVSCDDGTFIKCPFDANYGICVKNSSEEIVSNCEFKNSGTKATTTWLNSEIKANNPCGSSGLCWYSEDEAKASGLTTGQIVFLNNAEDMASTYKVFNTADSTTSTIVKATSTNVYYACSKGELVGTEETVPQYTAPCTNLKVYSTYRVPLTSESVVGNAKTNCGGYLCSKTNIEKLLSGKTGFVITQNSLYNLSSGTIGSSVEAITESGNEIYFACSNVRESSLRSISLPSDIKETISYPIKITPSYIEQQIKTNCSSGFADLYELETRLTTETGYVYGSKCLSPVSNGVMEKKCVAWLPLLNAAGVKIYYACASIPSDAITATTVTYGSTSAVY